MWFFWTIFSLSAFTVLVTALPILRMTNWWVRIGEFPRFQIAALALLFLILYLINFDKDIWWQYIMIGLLVWAIIFQLYKMHPYAGYNNPQVKRARKDHKGSPFSLMVANVLTPNRQSDKLINLIVKYDPDIILTLESDKWWGEKLEPLEKTYSYTIKKPLDNLYGMHLFSKLELVDPQIRFIVQDDIPSFHTRVKLRNGNEIKLHCIHPRPPSPSESDTSLYRDAELLIVGKEIRENNENVVVAGDLNDVAWSRTSWLFRKISGLLDPRIGRGLYNTFNAKYPLLRFPLDHVFHSDDFLLRKLVRLPQFGSDHFPLYISLLHNRETQDMMDEPDADGDDMEFANDTVNRINNNNNTNR